MRLWILLTAACLLQAADDPLQKWRKANDRVSRYEGRVTELVSAPSFDLLSLTRYKPAELKKQTQVIVRYPRDPATRVIVLARGLREHKSYRMESKPLTSSVFDQWPSHLFVDDIPISSLGIVAYVAEQDRLPDLDNARVLPLDLYSAGDKPGLADRYRVTLVSNVSLDQLQVTVKGPNDRSERPLSAPRSTRGKLPFDIDIPIAKLGAEGEYQITVSGTRLQPPNDPAFVRFRVFHAR